MLNSYGSTGIGEQPGFVAEPYFVNGPDVSNAINADCNYSPMAPGAAQSPLLAVSGGNVGGRDAAVEPTGMYSRRFPEETANSGDDSYSARVVTADLYYSIKPLFKWTISITTKPTAVAYTSSWMHYRTSGSIDPIRRQA